MEFLKLGCLLRGYWPPRLSQQGIHKQAPAHADTAMNPPYRKLDSAALESFPPGEHMLINAVDQRPIQIEKKGWRLRKCFLHLRAPMSESGTQQRAMGSYHSGSSAFLINRQTAALQMISEYSTGL